jgi:hypothetical protein
MRILRLLLIAGSLASLLASGAKIVVAGETVSLHSLLEEMVDRDELARFPKPEYTCRQFSSYDRDSTDPNNKATWFANMDRSQFVRIDEVDGHKEYVMMDADGPGAIVRMWATWHGPGGGDFSNGTLRIYIDGAEKPAIEGRASNVIDGGLLAGPPLSEGVSSSTPYKQRGHNLYLPIPYARHCKVTYSTDVLVDRGAYKGEALYYQINYRTYDSGTDIDSFSMEVLKDAKPLVEKVNRILQERSAPEQKGTKSKKWQGELKPKSSQVLFAIDEPGAVRRLRFKINAKNMPQALRSTVLEVKFDDEPTVWAPIGDFFGTGYHIRPYRTWYTSVSADGELACNWVMPFAKNATFVLHNLGDQEVSVEHAEANIGDWSWDDRSMHFHATWHQYSEEDTGETVEKRDNGRHAHDLNFTSVHGKGVYVGDALTVFNGAGQWWGEGDEKIYVDGEQFPSHIGTGTEDYFGYAWCRPEFFDSAFHAQPEGGGNLVGGFTVNVRYRALDAIPFTKSLKFDMELWHWAKTKVDYAPTSLFYARPGATSTIEPDPQSAARRVTLKREDIVKVYRVPGVIEAENLKAAKVTGGKVTVQEVPEFGWSNDRQVWWTHAHVGDEMIVEFKVEKPGKYEVIANLTKAIDYAIVTASVNDFHSAEPLDRFNPTVANDELRLGTFDLVNGVNHLTFKIEGANPHALKKYMVGIDYLKLVPAK